MLEIYNKIKEEEIEYAKLKDNIIFIKTDKDEYSLSDDFLDEYQVYATVSRYHDPKWGIRKKAS